MKFLNYLAIAAIALCTVSCDDDDDPVKDEVVAPAELVAGNYEGTIQMGVGKPGEPVAANVQLKAQSNGKLTVVLPQVGEGKMTMPSVTLTDVAINKVADNEYTVSKEAFSLVVNEMPLSNKKGLNGTIKAGVFSLNYDLTPGAMADMDMAISFTYKGEKK